jgi:nucleotide sugar dehydrogenase
VKVAIIGLGIIGRAQQRMFEAGGCAVVTYDPAYSDGYPLDEIGSCDFAVICVGTPPAADRTADLTYVCQALEALQDTLPVLIRSTMPPGTTDFLAGLRSGLTACAPEFLYERDGGAWSESTEVPYLIVGGTPQAQEYFTDALKEVFPGTIHQCAALVAELAKYTVNLYWAAKVTFVNEMAAIVRRFDANWEDVRAAWLNDPRVNDNYTRMEGFPPGYGGRCWPKDIAALIEHAQAHGYPAPFLQAIENCNGQFGGEVIR